MTRGKTQRVPVREGVEMFPSRVRVFAARIREVRNRRGLSQSDVARFLNVSQPSVVGWERGQKLPSHDTLPRLLTVLGVEFAWLLGAPSYEDDLAGLTLCVGSPGIFLSAEEDRRQRMEFVQQALRAEERRQGIRAAVEKPADAPHPLKGKIPACVVKSQEEKRETAGMTNAERLEYEFHKKFMRGLNLLKGS